MVGYDMNEFMLHVSRFHEIKGRKGELVYLMADKQKLRSVGLNVIRRK